MARCSTNESKQDIDRQRRELIAMGIKPENIFWEYESGTKDDRLQLSRLMETVKEGDSITSLEVSRLTRSTQKLCEIIQEVKEKKVRLIIAGSLGLLTYDLYRRNRKNIKSVDDTYWLCTPNATFTGTGSDYVQVVDADGEVDTRGCNWELDVRPFCILNIKTGNPT